MTCRTFLAPLIHNAGLASISKGYIPTLSLERTSPTPYPNHGARGTKPQAF
jgi:hypothetical protein